MALNVAIQNGDDDELPKMRLVTEQDFEDRFEEKEKSKPKIGLVDDEGYGSGEEDDYYNEIDEAVEEEIRRISGKFLPDVKVLVKQYVDQFFHDKRHHCGGKIPKSFLHNERRLSRVLNFDITDGVVIAYKFLEATLTEKELEISKRTGESTSDIRLVNETLNLLARSGVPQQLAGGMLLMYLEFVEGIEITLD